MIKNTAKKYWHLVILALLVVLVYHRAYFAQFVLWDDDALIMNNGTLKMPLWQALETAFSVYYHGDYFPLTLMSYWTDVYFFGESAQAMHLINLALQVFNVSLLYIFLKKLTKSETTALIICLFYGFHPLQTESVMWISERKSLISALYTFASLIFYLESYSENKIRRRWMLAGAILFFILASLSKATSILLPVLFVVLDFYMIKKNRKRILIRATPSVIAGTFLMYMRVAAYSASVGDAAGSFFSINRVVNIPTMALNAIGFYIQKFFMPIGLSALYTNYELNTKTVVVSILTLVFLSAVSFLIWKSKKLTPLFFMLWFILFLLPVLQIFPRINYVNDRYMYLPIIGFVGMIITLLPEEWIKFLDRTKSQLVTILAATALMAWPSYSASEVWVSNRSLWLNVIKNFPTSAIARNNLGLDYQAAMQYELAIDQYTTIIRYSIEEQHKLLAYNNLANIYADPKYSGFDYEKSIQLLTEGLTKVRRMRDSYEMRANLGIAYKKTSRVELAKGVFLGLLKDLQAEPDYRFQWLVPIIKRHLETVNDPR